MNLGGIMRYRLFPALLGFAVCAALPAAAQDNTQTNWQQQQQPVYAVPMYLSPNGSQQYNTQGGVPVYNNNAQPLPVEQLIAGKNAPSYNYNNNAYTGFGGSNPLSNVTSIGSLTPQQEAMVRAQRDAQAAAYQRDYLAGLGQQGTTPVPTSTGSSGYQGEAFSQLYNGIGQEQQQAPVRRRVVYREKNNPLTTPPRLFSID